jgi:hypothetical protein
LIAGIHLYLEQALSLYTESAPIVVEWCLAVKSGGDMPAADAPDKFIALDTGRDFL